MNNFYEKSLETYKENISHINSILEGDELIKLLFEYKMEALIIYNKIFYYNQDTFNNSQYLALYNDQKRKLESDIANIETKISDKNLEASSKFCSDLMSEVFGPLKNKLLNKSYTSNTLDEYIHDHENFLNNYLKESKGPRKVSVLIDFLTSKKPEIIKTILNSLELENNMKLEEAINSFNEAEKKKIEVEARKRNLDEKSQSNSEKVNLQ